MAQLQEGPWGTRFLRPHVLCARPAAAPSLLVWPDPMPPASWGAAQVGVPCPH